MSGTTALAATGVSRVYAGPDGPVLALPETSVEVDAGELVAVRGRSGSGKTTLLNLVAGLDQPTSGTIEVLGERVDTMSPAEAARWRARRVALVFQTPGLLPAMTAIGNVELGLRIAGVGGRGRRRDAARDALGRVGLAEHSEHRPSELSGGQQQRVAIARAIATGHQVLLADEPTAGLDTTASIAMFRLLGDLANDGATVLVTTHDPVAGDHVTRHIDLGVEFDA